jgi:aminoglycoside phosphotransferase (APT) family kinase protein
MERQTPPAEIVGALRAMGLLADGATTPTGRPLTGGVSSDIWLVELPGRKVAVKRALEKLKVAADWRAPVARNLYEARWMGRANAAVPGSAPALLGQDSPSGTLAMEYLPPESHRLWKAELHAGCTSVAFAEQVGCTLARIHGATAADPSVAADFRTDAIFFDIRLEPYLLATAARHPDRATALRALVATTQANKRALVHGDVSPKNILVGPAGPVFLDAECAWWGDPAFDLAFVLNHLLLKCLWTPRAQNGFMTSFSSLASAYLGRVTWEPAAALEARAAGLLPGLFLARVDGKSPVEYVTGEADKDRVRRVARAQLAAPPSALDDVAAAWRKELRR